MKNAYTVLQVVSYIKSVLEEDLVLCALGVTGEVSNFKAYPSGHLYFTLKDENAALKCVCFRGNAVNLDFVPQNGVKVTAYGNVSVYEKSGECQLYVQGMRRAGTGDLYAAFEQLKKRLLDEGLFDDKHKKPIPQFARHIAVVTSTQGAALRDILQIAARRAPSVKITVCGAKVQGADAAREIAAALDNVNKWGLADCIIVGRGGGAYEDLQAFNEECVARAIFNSRIPVISAVGHETDFTIADFVSDLRAPTPSAAAELAVFDLYGALAYAADCVNRANGIVSRRIAENRQTLMRISARRVFRNPMEYVNIRRLYTDTLAGRAETAAKTRLSEARARFGYLVSAAAHLSPLETIARGYALVFAEDGRVIKNIRDLPENITVKMHGGTAAARVTGVAYGKEETVL